MREQTTEVTKNESIRSIAVQVPAMTLEAVRPIVEQLYQAAGVPLSRPVLAGRLNTKTTSSGFMQKIAAAGYYGFIKINKGKASLTTLGEKFANNDISAAQEGFMNSAFGSIAIGLAGRTADLSTVALHLSERKQVPEASAERLAGILLRSAKEADLLKSNGFDAERIEELQHPDEHDEDNEAHLSPVVASPIASIRPETPKRNNAPAASLPSIEIAKGFHLTYERSLPVQLLTDSDFTSGLTSLKSAIDKFNTANDTKE